MPPFAQKMPVYIQGCAPSFRLFSISLGSCGGVSWFINRSIFCTPGASSDLPGAFYWFLVSCCPWAPRSSLSSAAASLFRSSRLLLLLPGLLLPLLCSHACNNMFASSWAPLGAPGAFLGVLAPGVYLLPWAYISRGLLFPGGFSLYSLQLHCSPISNAAPHRGHIL